MAFLEKQNLAPVARVRARNWSPSEIEEFNAGIAAGLTDKEVALKLGRTENAIANRRLRATGVLRRKPGEWPPERIEILKQLAAEGWSCGQIAQKMGATRAAIIGKRFRLGLPPRPRGINVDLKSLPHKPRKDGHASGYGKVGRGPRTAKVIPIAVVDPLRVGFMDLTRNHCRWVLEETGDDGLALYCGHEKLGSHSYCPGHWRVTTDRSKDRRFKFANPPLNKVFG